VSARVIAPETCSERSGRWATVHWVVSRRKAARSRSAPVSRRRRSATGTRMVGLESASVSTVRWMVSPCRSTRGEGSWPNPAALLWPSTTLPPVAAVFQSGATPGHQDRVGVGVSHPKPACGEERIQGQQPVQKASQRVGGAWRTVVVGVDIVAGHQSHHRGADLVRCQCSAERQEAVGLDLGHRPQVEALRTADLQNRLHDDHPQMMAQECLRAHSITATSRERPPRALPGRRTRTYLTVRPWSSAAAAPSADATFLDACGIANVQGAPTAAARADSSSAGGTSGT
jgi:hypothetical protein